MSEQKNRTIRVVDCYLCKGKGKGYVYRVCRNCNGFGMTVERLPEPEPATTSDREAGEQ